MHLSFQTHTQLVHSNNIYLVFWHTLMFPPLTHTLYSLASFLGPIPHFLIYSFKHPRTQVLHLALTRGISPIRIHIYNISAPRFFDFSTEAPSRSNLPPLPFFTLFLSRNSAFSLLHQSSSRQAHDPPPPFYNSQHTHSTLLLLLKHHNH